MHLDWEISKAAKTVVEYLLNLKEGENILIYADTLADEEVVQALARAAYLNGSIVSVFMYETRSEVGIEPPPPLAAAMKASDVIVELAEKYLIHTKAYHYALEAGARSLCITGMTEDMMMRCIGGIDYPRMVEFGNVLTGLLCSTHRMEVQTPAGTNLSFELGGRPVFHNSGIVSSPGDQSFLGGQISWAPVEDTINGVIVFDGSVWPPDELGILRSPIKMLIKNGEIKDMIGGREAKTFERWLQKFADPNMFKIAHVSYGFNPGARLTGKILEDERIFGCLEIGIGSQGVRFKGTVGSARAHTDGVMLNPTVWLDGELLEEEGTFVHPKLPNM